MKTRSDQTMFNLILNFASEDENIRAVVMNGSRVNPLASADPFQDFDIVYLVREVAPLKRGEAFVQQFGEIMIFQTPDDMDDPPGNDPGRYVYLMQFKDGTRIDLTLLHVDRAHECTDDSLARVLLDKDGVIPPLPPSNDRDYLPQPPTAKQFDHCCNEFWWVSPYIAKGLWRDEVTYAHATLETYVRPQFMKMLTWYFGVQTDFQRAPGKFGKYLQAGLDPDLWTGVERTYTDAQPEHIWDALLEMGMLFRMLGRAVADYFGFDYPATEDANVTAYLRHIRTRSRDVTSIY